MTVCVCVCRNVCVQDESFAAILSSNAFVHPSYVPVRAICVDVYPYNIYSKGSHRSAAVFAIGFIPGLIKSVLFELYLILSGKLDRYVPYCSHRTEPDASSNKKSQ